MFEITSIQVEHQEDKKKYTLNFGLIQRTKYVMNFLRKRTRKHENL